MFLCSCLNSYTILHNIYNIHYSSKLLWETTSCIGWKKSYWFRPCTGCTRVPRHRYKGFLGASTPHQALVQSTECVVAKYLAKFNAHSFLDERKYKKIRIDISKVNYHIFAMGNFQNLSPLPLVIIFQVLKCTVMVNTYDFFDIMVLLFFLFWFLYHL